MRRPGPLLLAALILTALLLLLLLRSGSRRTSPPPAAIPTGAAPLPVAPSPGSWAVAPASATGSSPADPASLPKEDGAKAALRIHGRVVDGSGTGIPGVNLEVRAWSGDDPDVRWTILRSLTTADGTFSLGTDRSLAARGFGIETAAEGFLEGWVSLKIEDYDEARGVEIAVESARSIVGRVVDEYARPIPKTTVQLWYGSETTWPTTVDSDGSFRTPARAPRRAFELVVEAPGYPRRSVPIPAGPGDESTDTGDLVFRRGGRLAGIAVDSGGRPLRDIPICVMGITGTSPSKRTDEGGRFAFENLGEGTVWVCTDGPATGPDAAGVQRTWRGRLDAIEVGRTDLRLELEAETIVILRFVDATNGDPVLVKESKSWIWPSGTGMPKSPNTGTSGSAGYSAEWITVVSGARYDAVVRSPGYEEARVEGIDVPDILKMTVDVPMRRSR